jgi:hypothetical protein
MSFTNNKDYNEYVELLYNKIIKQIISDMTIGRTDEDLEPYNEIQIYNFIKDNEIQIENVINKIIMEYKNDNALEELKTPENDWICEYLYEEVKIF